RRSPDSSPSFRPRIPKTPRSPSRSRSRLTRRRLPRPCRSPERPSPRETLRHPSPRGSLETDSKTMEEARERGHHTKARLEDSASHVPAQPLSPKLAEIARAFRARPFRTHKLLRGGHAQTLAAAFRFTRMKLLREERGLYESRLVEVDADARVLLKCRWQQNRR